MRRPDEASSLVVKGEQLTPAHHVVNVRANVRVNAVQVNPTQCFRIHVPKQEAEAIAVLHTQRRLVSNIVTFIDEEGVFIQARVRKVRSTRVCHIVELVNG